MMITIDSKKNYGKPSPREEVKAEKARRSLEEFVKQAWPIIETVPYQHNWHISAICQHLEAVTNGDIHQLLINMPPRHAKSTIVAVMWFAWSWIDYPKLKWMFSSYALSLSIRDSRKCRQIIESSWYQRNYGTSFFLAPDQNAKARFENNKRGYRLAVSTDSAATGEGGDLVVCDDANNAREAESAVQRQSVLDWWDRTMSTRVNDPKKGAKVIVMQRLHQQDLSGHVLEQGGYVHLNLPAEYEPSHKTMTSIGWQDPRTEEGELLWPERFGPAEIVKAKKTLGPMGYAGQYQQRPVPAEGAIFKQQWLRYYTLTGDYLTLELPEGDKHYAVKDCRRICTVDVATKKSTTADYTVIATWFITPDGHLVLRAMHRERMDSPEQQTNIKAAYRMWQHESVHIEAVAYQLALVQQLLPQGVPVVAFYPNADKVSRATTAAIFYAASMVFHPKHAEWLDDFEQELLMFPKAEHDDCVDAVSMACVLLFDGGDIPIATSGGVDHAVALPPPIEDLDEALQQRQQRMAGVLTGLHGNQRGFGM